MNIEQLKNKARKLITHHECEDPYYSCPKSPRGCINSFAGDECNCGYEKKIKKLDQIVDSAYKLHR